MRTPNTSSAHASDPCAQLPPSLFPAFRLQAPTCTDGVKNGAETDVDCGGADCQICVDGQMCNFDSDCFPDSTCQSSICQVRLSFLSSLGGGQTHPWFDIHPWSVGCHVPILPVPPTCEPLMQVLPTQVIPAPSYLLPSSPPSCCRPLLAPMESRMAPRPMWTVVVPIAKSA